jgi:hypothetical protein
MFVLKNIFFRLFVYFDCRKMFRKQNEQNKVISYITTSRTCHAMREHDAHRPYNMTLDHHNNS